jgi:hypothetical protein
MHGPNQSTAILHAAVLRGMDDHELDFFAFSYSLKESHLLAGVTCRFFSSALLSICFQK